MTLVPWASRTSWVLQEKYVPSQNTILVVSKIWQPDWLEAGNTTLEINSIPAPPSQHVQCNAGASICELGLTHENDGLFLILLLKWVKTVGGISLKL